MFFVCSALSMFALFAIYAAQVEASDVWGLLDFVIASLGNLGVLAEPVLGEAGFLVAGSAFTLGLILLAVGSLKASVFSRWVSWLWIAAVVVSLPASAIPSLTTVGFILGGLAFGTAFTVAGYELWSVRVARKSAG